MGRRRKYSDMDAETERKVLLADWWMVNLLVALGFSALILICLGLANDLTSGNRSLEVKVLERANHTLPTFTFCPIAESEGTLPNISYCSWNRELTIKAGQQADRDWGEATGDCPREMAAAGINVWRVHPVDPTCWILSGDTTNRLVPAGKTENMFLWFQAAGVGMRIWNSTATALAEDPSNSTESQGLRIVYGTSDLLEITEAHYQKLGQPLQVDFQLNQYGSFPLSAIGVDSVTILSINWVSDTIIVTSEKETISELTLSAIIVGSVAVAIDLLFRNWMLITYVLWIYHWFRKTGDEGNNPRQSMKPDPEEVRKSQKVETGTMIL